jgi:hypothetical protein
MKAIRGGKDSGKGKEPPPEKPSGMIKKMADTRSIRDLEYAEVLLQFIQPYMEDVPDIEELEKTLNLGLIGWNMAVIKQNDANFYKEYSKKFLTEIDLDDKSKQLLDKMIKDKEAGFDDYNVILMDCEIVPNKKGEVMVNVNSKTYPAFIDELMGETEHDENPLAGTLNRSSFAIVPKKPFHDWLEKTFFPGKLPKTLLEENTMYLIDSLDDKKTVEKWLKKNYDQVFSNELNEWTDDQKDWPKNRTYKMFLEWFDVKICSMIYDLGTSPILKD